MRGWGAAASTFDDDQVSRPLDTRQSPLLTVASARDEARRAPSPPPPLPFCHSADGPLARLAREAGRDVVDARRFRMLFELEGCTAHEDYSMGRTPLRRLGRRCCASAARSIRCAVTTRDPETGEPDLDTLRLLKDYRGQRPSDGAIVLFGALRRTSSGRASCASATRSAPLSVCASSSSRRCTRARPTPTWAFRRQIEQALRERGHEIELAVLDRRGGGKRRYASSRDAFARRAKPDVVYAHFLVPSGLIASRVDAPLVVTAHGRDVRNIGSIPGIAAAHAPCRRPRFRGDRRLGLPAPRARGEGARGARKDGRRRLRRRPRSLLAGPRDQRRLESPAFLCVGSLTERKNVVRLADAFARLGDGSLTFVGDGPLRARLEGRERVRVVGRVPHEEIPSWMAAARRRLPAEPHRAARPVAARGDGVRPLGRRDAVGGPPEFVPPEAGVLVDPIDVDALERGAPLRRRVAAPERGGRRRRGRARRQAAGGAGGGDPPASRSRSASLTSTSGRTSSSSPASRAASSA